jgi:integrase/recombinase XerD
VAHQVSFTGDLEHKVARIWKQGHVSSGSIVTYLHWARRFRAYCQKHQLDVTDELTLAGVQQFTRNYVGPRVKQGLAAGSCDCARNAIHAWACALRALGISLPPWREKKAPPLLSTLLAEYCHYRRSHNGVSERTLYRDIQTATTFIARLRRRGKTAGRATVADVDAFVLDLSGRFSRATVADTCSSLRSFLRFLHATGRLCHDLAKTVLAPRIRQAERPPRALPWSDVRRILRAIQQSETPGKRDYAMLLLMAAYGLGAAEVLSLRLEDVDWQAGILRVRRPKTAVPIELPLLPPVARALSAYLQAERPPAATIRRIFLSADMPYEPLTSGAIRHRIRHYAQQAGIAAKVIGAHAIRHSHASRQVDAGANLKVVSDILGHQRSSSTSVYVRVALRRLRMVALPVPR